MTVQKENYSIFTRIVKLFPVRVGSDLENDFTITSQAI
jgi:hypothetical protein